MKIEYWTKGDPPAGFVLGDIPNDYGIGRCAYKFDADGKFLLCLPRGDAVITYANGKQVILGLFTRFDKDAVLSMLKEVAENGLEIVGEGF